MTPTGRATRRGSSSAIASSAPGCPTTWASPCAASSRTSGPSSASCSRPRSGRACSRSAARAGIPVVLANARLSARSARALRARCPRSRAGRSPTWRASRRRPRTTRARFARAGRARRGRDRQHEVRPRRARQTSRARGREFRALASARGGASGSPAARARARRRCCSTRSRPRRLRPRSLLVIVPRHPQRFDEVAALAAGARLRGRAPQPTARPSMPRCACSSATPWARCSPTTPPPTW